MTTDKQEIGELQDRMRNTESQLRRNIENKVSKHSGVHLPHAHPQEYDPDPHYLPSLARNNSTYQPPTPSKIDSDLARQKRGLLNEASFLRGKYG